MVDMAISWLMSSDMIRSFQDRALEFLRWSETVGAGWGSGPNARVVLYGTIDV